MNGDQATALQREIVDLRVALKRLRKQMKRHEREHELQEKHRHALRWRIIGLTVAAVAAVDTPLVSLYLAHR